MIRETRRYILLISIFTFAAVLALHSVGVCETLLIGGNAPLSGSGASYGIGQSRGIEKAISEVNAKGGLNIGGTNYKLQFKAYDNKSKADEAVSIANKLVYRSLNNISIVKL